MRVLITGMNGFTGKYLSVALRGLGYEVFDLLANLCDANAVMAEVKRIKPELVIHLAAVSFVAHENIREIYEINLLGTYNFLLALYRYVPNVRRILIASSANIYGNCNKNDFIDEDVAPSPMNDYAVSKLSMEYMCGLWRDKLPIVIVRPFNYTGIGQNVRFVVPKIVSHFVERKPVIELGNMHVLREYNDVRFIADVYSKLLIKDTTNGVFNVCTGRVYSLQDIMKICTSITNHKIEARINPNFIRKNEVEKLVGSNRKLKALLGNWTDYTLEKTLGWMLKAI